VHAPHRGAELPGDGGRALEADLFADAKDEDYWMAQL